MQVINLLSDAVLLQVQCFPQGNQVLTLYSHFPCDHCSSLKSLSCVAGCWVCREVGNRLRQSKQSIRYNAAKPCRKDVDNEG